jgi:hypothetical protein
VKVLWQKCLGHGAHTKLEKLREFFYTSISKAFMTPILEKLRVSHYLTSPTKE